MDQAVQANWLQRNWRWVVPTGCLGIFLALAALVAGVVFLVFGALRSTDVTQQALSRAQEHPAVEKAVGSPLKAGWPVTGSVSVRGASGEADLSIPVSGPGGKARIYAVAVKAAGRWEFTTLEVEIAATGERINLLPSHQTVRT